MLGLYRSAGPHSTSYADIDYRDHSEGSKTKLPAFSDGMTALRTIMPLLKDYRPMALFGWLTLIFVVVGLAFGILVVAEFAATGLVPHLPTALLAVGRAEARASQIEWLHQHSRRYLDFCGEAAIRCPCIHPQTKDIAQG